MEKQKRCKDKETQRQEDGIKERQKDRKIEKQKIRKDKGAQRQKDRIKERQTDCNDCT